MATPTVLTYVYIRGKWYAFPDTNSAREGAVKYKGNLKSLRSSKPIGVLIDDKTFIGRPRSFWPNALSDAQGVIGNALINPPVNPIHGPTPMTPANVPVVTQTSRVSYGGTNAPHPPERVIPKKQVWDFPAYVLQNPDLTSAYLDYVREEDPTNIDSWELHGKELGVSDLGAPHYGGSTMNVDQWGQVHWEKYGEGESRQNKAFTMV
jgi:hypothetical protein